MFPGTIQGFVLDKVSHEFGKLATGEDRCLTEKSTFPTNAEIEGKKNHEKKSETKLLLPETQD